MPAITDSSTRAVPRAARIGAALVFVPAVASIIALAVYRLRRFPYPLDPVAAVRGVATTASVTVPAAVTTWLIIGIVVITLARWLRRRVPDLSPGEATVGGVVLFWSATYAALLTLGPLGLYRPIVLRGLVLALVLILSLALGLSRRERPRGRRRPGVWIAALAFTLVAGPLLLVQTGSPVSPFMDILPYVASAQKIVTFQFYDPFGNDAAGLWSPTRQVVGCDAPFSFLALVGGIPAHLAITSLIVPLAAFQLLAIYLLGRRIQGSLAGGMATLFLLQTFVWRRTADGRGTALAFALVAVGIAFLLATRERGPRVALGGLALGLAVTVNPLIGAIGMQVAAAATMIEAIDFRRGFVARVLALAAGSIFALPQVMIGLAWRVPPWTLPFAVGAGAGLALLVARPPPGGGRPAGRAWAVARLAVIVALPLRVLFLHAGRQSGFFTDDWFGYGPLFLFAAAGLVVTARETWRRPGRWPASAVPALALWVAMLDYTIADPLRFQGGLEMRSLASEVTTKVVYYWWPYWLALFSGVWFGMLAHRWGRLPALVVALALVIYPLRHVQEPLDFDVAQYSLAETWGFQLTHAANGYWAGHPDRRWVVDADWRDIAAFLLGEVAAGRIAYDTHVLDVTPSASSVEAALVTGISMDLVTPAHDPTSIWTVNGRIRGFDALPAAFAARPRYVLIEQFPPAQFPQLADYDEVMVRRLARLYRLKQSAPAPPPLSSDAG